MLTIGITTFKHRLDTYFRPLLQQIRGCDKDIEIIVAINGEHGEQFTEYYRSEILHTIAQTPKTFPIMFPTFRGLSKLWNTLLVHASNDYVLVLNDDVTIRDVNFIPQVINSIKKLQTSFQINDSFSHVVMKKDEILYDLGGINEQLLGIGEEEYIMWTWAEKYGKEFVNEYINGIVNHVDFTHAPTNIKEIEDGNKYSQFNRETMYNTLFNIDEVNGVRHGKIPVGLIKMDEAHIHQYPYEKFYKENKDKL